MFFLTLSHLLALLLSHTLSSLSLFLVCLESMRQHLFKLFRSLGFTPPPQFEMFRYDLVLQRVVSTRVGESGSV